MGNPQVTKLDPGKENNIVVCMTNGSIKNAIELLLETSCSHNLQNKAFDRNTETQNLKPRTLYSLQCNKTGEFMSTLVSSKPNIIIHKVHAIGRT